MWPMDWIGPNAYNTLQDVLVVTLILAFLAYCFIGLYEVIQHEIKQARKDGWRWWKNG